MSRPDELPAQEVLASPGSLTHFSRLYQKGLISHLDTLLTQLRSAGFYTGKEYDEILKEAEEG